MKLAQPKCRANEAKGDFRDPRVGVWTEVNSQAASIFPRSCQVPEQGSAVAVGQHLHSSTSGKKEGGRSRGRTGAMASATTAGIGRGRLRGVGMRLFQKAEKLSQAGSLGEPSGRSWGWEIQIQLPRRTSAPQKAQGGPLTLGHCCPHTCPGSTPSQSSGCCSLGGCGSGCPKVRSDPELRHPFLQDLVAGRVCTELGSKG